MQIDVDQILPESMDLIQKSASTDPCLLKEKCLNSDEGLRWVLRFATRIKNIGDGKFATQKWLVSYIM